MDKSKKKKDDQSSLLNTMTNNINKFNQDPTSKDLQQQLNEIELELQKEKREEQRLKVEIQMRDERFSKREKEYRRYIEELQDEIKNKGKKISKNPVPQEPSLYSVKELHEEIQKNINSIKDKTSKILVEQEKDIIRFFNNKINEIKKQFEEERIKKGKKDQDYIEKENKLISELEWIKNIAQKIDSENHNLMKKYMDLKAQYQTQENDREMLLKELIMKKKKNVILNSHIKQYKKMVDELQKDHVDDVNDSQFQQTNGSKLYKQGYNSQGFGKSQQLSQSQIKEVEKIHQDALKRSQNAFTIVKSTLQKEQKRVRELKNLYVKEMETKSELEKIIKQDIAELKQELNIDENQSLKNLKKQINEAHLREFRRRLIDKLLNNDTVLTIVYDKTFYPDVNTYTNDQSQQQTQQNNNNNQINAQNEQDDYEGFVNENDDD